jgi:hypothetical protein
MADGFVSSFVPIPFRKRTRNLASMENVQSSLLMARVLKNHAPMLCLHVFGCQRLSFVIILGCLGLEDRFAVRRWLSAFVGTAFYLIQRPV